MWLEFKRSYVNFVHETKIIVSMTVTVLSVAPWLSPLLFALFLVCLAIELLKMLKRLHFSRERTCLEQFPGPKAFPVVGNVADMIFTDFYEWSARMCQRWGDPLRLWRFGHPMIFVSTYEYAIQLLSKSNFNGKMHDLDMIRRQPGGKGLSTTPASTHAQKRKMLLPAFSRQLLEASVPIFCEEVMRVVEKFQKFADRNQEFDVVDPLMCALFRMVARSDFGDNFMSDTDENEHQPIKHMNALHTIAKNMSARILSPHLWNRSDFLYFNLTQEGSETRTARDIINSFARNAINKRRRYLENDKNEKRQICYLDVLLDLMDKREMEKEDVVSELNNFMGGAYDTTALAVCWTLLLLALHPKEQQRCFDELSEMDLQQSPSNFDYLQTKSMPYLELCLKESLRLFPPAPIFPRSTVDDVTLEDGRTIPGGVDVLIFANLIHRDPEFFPQPDKFIPERHLEGSPRAYMPFSLGVRNCIGQTYGMVQAKIILAYLIHAFEWKAPDDVKHADQVKVAYQGLLYPAEGIKLQAKTRSPK